MKKTADSLDDIALKILFVSVQQNNLELCVTYAVKQYALGSFHLIAAEAYSSLSMDSDTMRMVCMFRMYDEACIVKDDVKEDLVLGCLQWFRHAYVG